MLLCKHTLVHMPTHSFFVSSCLEYGEYTKGRSSAITASAVAMHVTCVFFFLSWSNKQDNKFCFKVRKAVIETIKNVKLFVEMELCLVCMFSGG